MTHPSVALRRVLLVLTSIAAISCDEAPTAPSAQPGPQFQLALNPATVDAGATSQGIVTVVAPAQNTDTEVRLSSSDGVAVVPAAVILPARNLVATFTVRTRLVAADTTAIISAAAGGEKREATLRVMAPIAQPPMLQALEIEPSVLKGGQTAQGTIRLNGPALAPMAVSVRSSNAVATPPGTVTVLPGASVATFPVTTRPVTLDTMFDIVATLADQTRAVQIHLTP
jgi:hypothetical protein